MIIPGTKGDYYFKNTALDIIKHGSFDKNPRPHWDDGTPAHTYSVNHRIYRYEPNDISLLTYRPIYWKKAIGELLWIYQDASNDLDLLKEKYGVTWWDEWDIGNRTIGSCYGETVRKHSLMVNLLKDLMNNPDGRRHIMNLWQEEDFKDKHGLKPCCYETVWNVRWGYGGDVAYLDMALRQRSSDWLAAGSINHFQYQVLLHLVAKHCGYEVGNFTVFVDNVQLYDRHIDLVEDILDNRKPLDIYPKIVLKHNKINFFDFNLDDIAVIDYDTREIARRAPQIRIPIAI